MKPILITSHASLSYCGREVQRFDNDRFLASLFAPAARRESLFALYAFNLEIAKTREVVREPMLGQIRLQWWRESIEGIYAGAVRRHAVVESLADAVRRHDLDRRHLDALVDAREADLEDQPPESLASLDRYAEATSAPLVLLGLEALGARAPAAAEAGRRVGIAWALTGLLRAVPFHARQRRLYLPAELLARHGVAPGRVFEGTAPPALKLVVAEVAAAARAHLHAARRLAGDVPRAALPALLLASLAGLYLRTLARADHDVFAPRVQVLHPLRQALLAWQALRGRY